MSEQAERHSQAATRFSQVIAATTDWQAQTPVADWKAADVVEHLLGWFPPALGAWSSHPVELDPAAPMAERWDQLSAHVQAILDDPVASATPMSGGPFQGQPVGVGIDMVYTADVIMHTWDLAQAGGIEVEYDQEYAAAALAGMRPIEQVLRDSGHYGPGVETDSEEPMVQLMAFVGRDPNWRSNLEPGPVTRPRVQRCSASSSPSCAGRNRVLA